MENVKALCFDVGGTVFDWKNTIREKIQALSQLHRCNVDDVSFADDWRKEMFKVLTQVRQGDLPWMNADDMLVQALQQNVEKYPLLSFIDDPMGLVKETWHRMHIFDGAAEAIARLRSRYTVVVLTILSWQSIVVSSKAAGLQWDGILSCEFLRYYKPSRQAYRNGVRLLGIRLEEAMMVAAHEGDLAAAQRAGLNTAYVGVPEDDFASVAFEQKSENGFDVEAENFSELCRKLGV